jgi:hypothetical protein
MLFLIYGIKKGFDLNLEKKKKKKKLKVYGMFEWVIDPKTY